MVILYLIGHILLGAITLYILNRVSWGLLTLSPYSCDKNPITWKLFDNDLPLIVLFWPVVIFYILLSILINLVKRV